jgi:hypothetical protein
MSITYGEGIQYKISRLLSLYVLSYGSATNHYYLLPMEVADWQRIGVWIGLFGSIVLCLSMKGLRRMIAAFPFVLAIVCAIFFWRPSADLTSGGPQDSWGADQIYYEITNQVEEGIYDDADFKVKRYRLELQINRQLTATAEVSVDQPNLDEYRFTLYHRYRVNSITNQYGKPMEFTQTGDYISVRNVQNNSVEALFFEYGGVGKAYYSTHQGMFLPAYFEYYPIPGFQRVYLDRPGYSGFTLECLPYKVEFEVGVDTAKEVYCNLDTVGGNRFQGVSDGLTLLSGLFVRESNIGNTRVVYSFMDFDKENDPIVNKEGFENFLQSCRESGYSLNEKTIFIPPLGNYDSYCFASDHFIGSLINLKYWFERYNTNTELYYFMDDEEYQKELDKLEDLLYE